MEDQPSDISKTKQKKQAHALQKLGETLAGLPIHHIKAMDLPETLRQALIDGKSITANVAARRHRQYIGVLMRDADPESLRLELENLDEGQPPKSPESEAAREWMDRLLTLDPAAVEDLLTRFPGLERQQVRQLLRNTTKKQAVSAKARATLEGLILDHIKSDLT
jgi:ribosome-associated protein